MITATRLSPRRSLRALATVTLALLLTVGASACTTPTPTDVPRYAVATHNDPEFDSTFRAASNAVVGTRPVRTTA